MRNKNKKGFTLIELLVAMTIFVVVVMIVFGLFSAAIRGQRRVMAMQNIQENARFILEFMAKEIRMSKINSVNASVLNVTRYGELFNDVEVEYVFYNGDLLKDNVQINSDEVSVTGKFYYSGITDDGQPIITIVLKVQGIGSRTEEQSFVNVQTTLSQRVLDI